MNNNQTIFHLYTSVSRLTSVLRFRGINGARTEQIIDGMHGVSKGVHNGPFQIASDVQTRMNKNREAAHAQHAKRREIGHVWIPLA